MRPDPAVGTLDRSVCRVARWADGWNAAYITPEEYGRLNRVLDGWCETEGTDADRIERTINLTFNLGVDEAAVEAQRRRLAEQWGAMAERIAGGSLLCTPDQATERILTYAEAGADAVVEKARASLDDGDYRWVAEVVHHVIQVEPDHAGARCRTPGCLTL